jgi:hypothetical protein
LRLFLTARTCQFRAAFFNVEISGLADRFVMEIEENVNFGPEKRQFSKIPYEVEHSVWTQRTRESMETPRTALAVLCYCFSQFEES